MSDSLVPFRPSSALSVPWRDPHNVLPAELASHICTLEQMCVDHPNSVELRTVLGIAHAVNHDVHKSMDVLEAAVSLDPGNFWAALKYAELHYRLRALARAEELTVTALNLATNGWQLALARKQLQEIRGLSRNAARNLTWKMPIVGPALALTVTLILVAVAFLWM